MTLTEVKLDSSAPLIPIQRQNNKFTPEAERRLWWGIGIWTVTQIPHLALTFFFQDKVFPYEITAAYSLNNFSWYLISNPNFKSHYRKIFASSVLAIFVAETVKLYCNNIPEIFPMIPVLGFAFLMSADMWNEWRNKRWRFGSDA